MSDNKTVDAQSIGSERSSAALGRTTHPDAQWFPEAGLGLFIHWGISSVHGGIDLSWGMMGGTPSRCCRKKPSIFWNFSRFPIFLFSLSQGAPVHDSTASIIPRRHVENCQVLRLGVAFGLRP